MKREGNYDLLRVVSAAAVIMIHVSATWFHSAIADVAENGRCITDLQSPFWICVYYSLPRFAVPCFVMLSGAFLLDNGKNKEYRQFYSKSYVKIGIPTIIFSVLYILYRLPQYAFGKYIADIDYGLGTLLADIVKGRPMNHMWYLYMLIGVYALVPIVLRFKDSISEKSFYKISFIFLALAGVSNWTGAATLNWDVGQSFEFLGYFMAGYSIRKISGHKKNGKALRRILSGLLLELCAAGLEYQQMKARIAEKDLKFQIISPYSPLIVLASVLIFYGFTLLDMKADFSKLSGLTFYIYLVHGGVWDVVCVLCRLIKGKDFITGLNGAVWIPMFVVFVFGVSCPLSRLYLYIWDKLDKEKRITNYFVRFTRLQTAESLSDGS